MNGVLQIARVSAFCLGLLLILVFVTFDQASAQGGIACRYGPTKYRDCCRESYRNKPNLGARARAADIEACMEESGVLRSKERSSRDSNEGQSDDDGEEPKSSKERPSPKWNSPRPSWYRWLDCAAGECTDGCSTDEIVISAFCNVGLSPVLYGDGSLYCANASGKSELPVAIICAKN